MYSQKVNTEACELKLSVRWEPQKVSTFSFEEEIYRLLLGAPFPMEYVLHGTVLFPSQVIFAYFFLHRSSLLDPLAMPLIHALSVPWALRAHFPDEVNSLLRGLDTFHDLESALRTVELYFSGHSLLLSPEMPLRIVDQGTNGFVVAEASYSFRKSGEYALYHLYAKGHLRGVVFYPGSEVLIFTKSSICWDLNPLEGQFRVIHETGGYPLMGRTPEGNLLGTTFLTRDQVLNLCVRVLYPWRF